IVENVNALILITYTSYICFDRQTNGVLPESCKQVIRVLIGTRSPASVQGCWYQMTGRIKLSDRSVAKIPFILFYRAEISRDGGQIYEFSAFATAYFSPFEINLRHGANVKRSHDTIATALIGNYRKFHIIDVGLAELEQGVRTGACKTLHIEVP